MAAEAEPMTVLEAIVATARAKGMTADQRERSVARLLLDLRIERVTESPGRVWLHHPDYVDTIMQDDKRLRRLQAAGG